MIVEITQVRLIKVRTEVRVENTHSIRNERKIPMGWACRQMYDMRVEVQARRADVKKRSSILAL